MTTSTLPSKPKHYRKTFATPTLHSINSRLQYYRRVLQQPLNNTNEKTQKKRQQLQQKYDRDMKVRNLLNRAVRHLYE